MSHHWSTLFTQASSTLSQSTKRRTRIYKASTSTSANAITSIVRTSIISSIDNIVVNRSIIVTIANSWLTFVFAINSRFVLLKFALYVINQIVDQSIIRKKNAKTRKDVLRIAIQNENRIQNFNVAWNNSLSKLKIVKKMISSRNFSTNWSLTSTFRSIILRSLILSLKKSTANRKRTSSLSIRSMIRRQLLQLSSCLLTRHLNTN
jgi:hypothetical protein